MKYFVGLIMVALGIIMVIKTEWFLGFFGRVSWAEEKLGAEGGSRLFYKLFGVILIFGALLITTGRINSILEWIFIH